MWVIHRVIHSVIHRIWIALQQVDNAKRVVIHRLWIVSIEGYFGEAVETVKTVNLVTYTHNPAR